MKKTVIVLPTFNEAGSIEKTIQAIRAVAATVANWHIDILVVDDLSPDGTSDIVKRLQKKDKSLHLLSGKKQGLGKAYMRGFTYALEKLSPYVIFEMDADGQHPAGLIPHMLKKIEDGADFVIGSRYMRGGSIPKTWGIERKFYSMVGNLVAQLGFMNLAVKDWTSGYRAMRVWVAKDLVQEMGRYTGYVFQIALLDKAIKKHAVIAETPLKFGERTQGVSKINAGGEIVNGLTYIFLNSSFVKFVIVGLIGFAVDFGFAYTFIHALAVSKPIANSLSAEGAIFSNFMFNNFWSFKHKKIQGGPLAYLSKFLFFNVVSSGSILIQGFGMYFALKFFGDTVVHLGFMSIQSWILYKVFIIGFIIIPYSYLLYNKVVWRKK